MKKWATRDIHTVSEADIENLLLSLSLYKDTIIDETTGKKKFIGYSESYQSSFRKCLKLFYKYLHTNYGVVSGDMAQNIDTKPQKLKVLSLFSGIGAPERALENIGIDFELVNYCEFDDNASYAYHLLHGAPIDKDLTDVELLDYEYCKQTLPDFDIMVLGSPCQDFSRNGKQKGLFKDHDRQTSTTQELFDNLKCNRVYEWDKEDYTDTEQNIDFDEVMVTYIENELVAADNVLLLSDNLELNLHLTKYISLFGTIKRFVPDTTNVDYDSAGNGHRFWLLSWVKWYQVLQHKRNWCC